MSAKVLKIKVAYDECGEYIWRIFEVSDQYSIAQLGYLVLASFDTCAYHLFSINFGDKCFMLPDEDTENHDDISLCLSKLNLTVGDKLSMIYDFGCDQKFNIEIVDIQEMKRGSGRAYPKIVDGSGVGIMDDTPACELLSMIKEIEKTGQSSFVYHKYHNEEHERFWDYRDFDIKISNMLLKGEVQRIQTSFELN